MGKKTDCEVDWICRKCWHSWRSSRWDLRCGKCGGWIGIWYAIKTMVMWSYWEALMRTYDRREGRAKEKK